MIKKDKANRLVHFCFWAVPLATLILSYLFLAFEHRSFLLFSRIVHENGKYTLLGTIFYWDHFIRELLPSVMMGAAVGIGFFERAPTLGVSERRNGRQLLLYIFALLAGLLAVAVYFAIKKTGVETFKNDLLQHRISDTEIICGSHWRSHWLHILFIFPTCIAISKLYRGFVGVSSSESRVVFRAASCGWAAVFVLFTVMYGFTEALDSTRFLAHQAREIATHSLITILLAFGTVSIVEQRIVKPHGQRKEDMKLFKTGLLFLGLSSLVPVFILYRLHGRDIKAHAQKQSSYLDLLASHNFEHSIDYVFVSLLSAGVYLALVYTRDSCLKNRHSPAGN